MSNRCSEHCSEQCRRTYPTDAQAMHGCYARTDGRTDGLTTAHLPATDSVPYHAQGGRARNPDAEWTRSGYPWFDEARAKRHLAPAALPTAITDDDRRPVAGRILGPTGHVIRVVRHGEEPPPFGFTGASA